jgi:hypothetical protein
MSDMNRLIIYEINTWVWLHDLEEKTGMRLTMDQVPEEEWDRIYCRLADGDLDTQSVGKAYQPGKC